MAFVLVPGLAQSGVCRVWIVESVQSLFGRHSRTDGQGGPAQSICARHKPTCGNRCILPGRLAPNLRNPDGGAVGRGCILALPREVHVLQTPQNSPCSDDLLSEACPDVSIQDYAQATTRAHPARGLFQNTVTHRSKEAYCYHWLD